MRYFLFLDESGDHGLKAIDAGFPVFVLCGILVNEADYKEIRDAVNQIKSEIWNHKKVIFHSRDIRKCQNEFQILFDLETKKRFYEAINTVLGDSNYVIISSAIQKEDYIRK